MLERVVEWTDFGQDDLRAIVLRIAFDSVENAMAVMQRIERRGSTLRLLSTRGRIVPELRRLGENRYHELIEAPWRLIYDVETQHVRIIAIVDSRRDLGEWMNEQPARFRLSRA